MKRGLFRRLEERVKFAERPSSPPLEAVRRPAHVARMLALAHHIQWAIDDGRVADRAAVARGLGLTRARVTQLLDLLLLAPDVQEVVLGLEAVDGVEPMSERSLRAVARMEWWAEQRREWTTNLALVVANHYAEHLAGGAPCPFFESSRLSRFADGDLHKEAMIIG